MLLASFFNRSASGGANAYLSSSCPGKFSSLGVWQKGGGIALWSLLETLHCSRHHMHSCIFCFGCTTRYCLCNTPHQRVYYVAYINAGISCMGGRHFAFIVHFAVIDWDAALNGIWSKWLSYPSIITPLHRLHRLHSGDMSPSSVNLQARCFKTNKSLKAKVCKERWQGWPWRLPLPLQMSQEPLINLW